jgi:hypothetical protein
MRVLVTGDRGYINSYKLYGEPNRIDKEVARIMALIHSGAPGAEAIASSWAHNRRGVEEIISPHDDLLELIPDLVVAFRGGNETADMVQRAKNAGVKVVEVR